MNSERPDREADALRNLLPELSGPELDQLWARAPDDFSIAENLVYYSQEVRALAGGALFVIQELEAMFAFRDDLDDQLRQLPDTALRTYLVVRLDVIDADLMSATVPQTPRWRSALAAEEWWWHRTPRRTDQRLFLNDRWERAVKLPDHIQRRYDTWAESGDDRPFAEWWRAQRSLNKEER